MRMPVRVLISTVALVMGSGYEPAAQPAPRYVVTPLASGLKFPWSQAFLPDGGILISEKRGGLQLFKDGVLAEVAGAPVSFAKGDGGLLDVVLDPDFTDNRRLYLAFVEGDERANRVAVLRARFDGTRLTDPVIIFRNTTDKSGAGHPGGRIAFLPDKTLLLTLGDGYDFLQQAQDPGSGLGKIVRLTRDGGVPADNPVMAGAVRGLYTLGHRNVQGLHYDAEAGTMWSHEHGPRGGDEVNVITAGGNYGWPKTTFGIDYDGDQISRLQTADGVTNPVVVWVPSIAPSGLTVYRGNRFPDWRGDLLLGGLASRDIRRVRIVGGKQMLQEVLLDELGARIRDVRTGPDGYIYVLTDEANGRLLRLEPASGRGSQG